MLENLVLYLKDTLKSPVNEESLPFWFWLGLLFPWHPFWGLERWDNHDLHINYMQKSMLKMSRLLRTKIQLFPVEMKYHETTAAVFFIIFWCFWVLWPFKVMSFIFSLANLLDRSTLDKPSDHQQTEKLASLSCGLRRIQTYSSDCYGHLDLLTLSFPLETKWPRIQEKAKPFRRHRVMRTSKTRQNLSNDSFYCCRDPGPPTFTDRALINFKSGGKQILVHLSCLLRYLWKLSWVGIH